MSLGQSENWIEIRRMPGIIDRQNRAGVGCDALRDSIRIEVQRVGGDISKDRTRSLVEHAVRSRVKRQRRGKRLIAGLQTGRERLSAPCRGAGTESVRLRGA